MNAANKITSISVRPLENIAGGPERPLQVHIELLDGQHVTLYSTFADSKDAADLVAAALETLHDTSAAIYAHAAARSKAVQECEAAKANVRRIEERLRHFLSGGRFFGRCIVVMDEKGGCWLQDPVKRDSGFGFYFDKLSDLWQQFPDLRPVSWANGELLVESVPYIAPT